MSSSNDGIASEPAAEKAESPKTIYDRIYDRVCSLLTEDRVAELRDMLRSLMSHEDLTSFCTDPSKLSLINHNPPAKGRGPVRAFRSSLFSVRLVVFVETDPTDADVQRVQVTADIQDGGQSGTRPLVDWTKGVTGTSDVHRMGRWPK